MKEIPLTKGYVALVDDDDYERVNAHKWYATVKARRGTTTVYAGRQSMRRTILMHRFILGCKEKVDHIDTSGINNQRYNLRPANNSQNKANSRKASGRTSIYKGVSWHKDTQKWQAAIAVNWKTIYLGVFKDECDAAQAYNFAAEEHFGEFARFNTPEMSR